MSLFLGPIHYIMNDRVLLQDDLSEALLAEALRAGRISDEDVAELNAKAPAASREPLETQIDTSNIHGWLARAVAGSEARFAGAVSLAVGESDEALRDAEAALEAFGAGRGLEPVDNARAAFQAFSMQCLDGMPCDRPFLVEIDSPSEVAWTVVSDPHAAAFEAVELSPALYYRLRSAYAKGLLKDSPFVYEQLSDQSFRIARKEA